MKIAIDLTALYGRKITGLEIYGIDLYKALKKLGYDVIPIFHVKNEIDDNQNAYIIPQTKRLILENVKLPKVVRRIGADVTLFPIFPPPLNVYWHSHTRIVPTIHDVAFLKFRDTINLAAKYYLTPKYKMAFKKADAIITISETEKKELNKLTKRPVFNCHNIISADYKTSDSYINVKFLNKWNLEKEKYIISVSTIEPRKNFKYLLKVIKPFLEDNNMKLVLVGRKGWDKSSEYERVLHSVEDKVIFTNFVSLSCLMTLYRYSYAFALLSLDEGFGRTPYEAVASGCKRVILSDIAVFHETFGGNALYLPLNDEKGCINILEGNKIPEINKDFRIPFDDLENYLSNALDVIVS